MNYLETPSRRGAGRRLAAVVLALGCARCRAAELDYPIAAVADPSGVVYLADRGLPGVWRLEGDRLSLFFQASKKFRRPLNAIRCLALDREGRLLAGDSATCDVYRFDATGQPRPLTAQAKPHGDIGIPMGIAVDRQGNLFVSDLETHRILKIPAEGGRPEPFVALPAPRGICFDASGRLWAISGRTLVRISAEGKKETIVADGVFQFPHAVVVPKADAAYVSDGQARTIWKVVDGGKPEAWVRGEPLENPVGLAVHADKLLVVDPRAKAVFEIDAAGKPARRRPAF